MHNITLAPQNEQSPDRSRMGVYEARPPRTRTCLNGKLVYGDGAFTLDCTVRDVSKGGAKITLTKRQPLPSHLYLIIIKYGIAHNSTVRWSSFPARGLYFWDTYSLSETLPAELRYLRQLWLNLCARPGAHAIADQPASSKWRL
jgi:hypothetical protein